MVSQWQGVRRMLECRHQTKRVFCHNSLLACCALATPYTVGKIDAVTVPQRKGLFAFILDSPDYEFHANRTKNA